MKESEIPDANILMMCEVLICNAFSQLPVGDALRNCRSNELEIWKATPFDHADFAKEITSNLD
jgi:hypothetical protein